MMYAENKKDLANIISIVIGDILDDWCEFGLHEDHLVSRVSKVFSNGEEMCVADTKTMSYEKIKKYRESYWIDGAKNLGEKIKLQFVDFMIVGRKKDFLFSVSELVNKGTDNLYEDEFLVVKSIFSLSMISYVTMEAIAGFIDEAISNAESCSKSKYQKHINKINAPTESDIKESLVYSYNDLCKRYGVIRSTIRTWIKEKGFPKPYVDSYSKKRYFFIGEIVRFEELNGISPLE